ncbi:MAG: ABC transporter permease [Lachnospiraceae bacterium]
MFAIFKRELQSYFNSVIGYLVMAAMLLFIGIYYVFINLTYAHASFATTLGSVNFIFIIVIPILTMRSMSEERKNKTDQLLLTSPVSVPSIVMGKYLSMVSVFGLVCLISCIFPLLLKSMGSTKMLVSYSMLLAFFLFGCAAIAIGLFISSLTENQILACVGTVGVLLILELMQSISTLIPDTAVGSYVGLIFIVLIAAYIVMCMTNNWIIAGTGGLIGCVILTILFLVKKSVFEGLLPDFLNSLCLSSHLDNFANEIFDVPAIVFYLSVIAVFLFLTVQTVEKRRWSR